MTTSSAPAEVARVAEAITGMLRERPRLFMDLVRALPDTPYRTLLLAWGAVRERHRLSRTEDGCYFLAPQA